MIHGGVLLEGWCQLLLDGLAEGGVSEVVVSPGSRSTPIVLAAFDHPRLGVQVIVDERAASFYALGRARATGRPPLLVRTSGSAGGHDLPAVIEAKESGWPMVVLTADRPFELAGVRAPQTIDQTRMFGEHAAGFFDLGLADPAPLSLRAARRVGVQAASLARGPRPGAVQVNLRARKPLEPPERGSEEDAAFRARVRVLRDGPPPRIFAADPPAPSAEGLQALRAALAASRRPLVVAGPAAPRSASDRTDILRWIEQLGAPTFLEATSQLRFGPGGLGGPGLDAVLRSERLRARLAPDLVLQLGDPAIASGLQAALSTWGDASRWVIASRGGFPDPDARASVLHADLAATARAFVDAGGPGPQVDRAWAESWRRAAAASERATSAVAGGDRLSEADVVRAARAAVPPGGRLMIGNSLPVRHLDMFVASGGPAIDVLHQRGASGIDGLIAGAVGASRDRPCVLVVGDVSARHDLGGLALAGAAGEGLVVVVIHNAGGRIFEQLPIAQRLDPSSAALGAFTTPDTGSLVPVATALGWSAEGASSRAELEAAFGAPADRRPRFIEARVDPHEARASLARVVEAVDADLAGGS